MRIRTLRKILVFIIIMTPVVAYQGCKKQPKCGCGKDMIYELKDAQVIIQYSEATKTAIFYPAASNGSTYYFCNPEDWLDSLKKLNTSEYLLVSGKAYYECNYLYNSGNSYYPMPPVYQVEVSSVKADNYGKK